MSQDNKKIIPFKWGIPNYEKTGSADWQCRHAQLAGGSTDWPIRARFWRPVHCLEDCSVSLDPCRHRLVEDRF